MKTLKESILNRSSHGAKGFEVQRRTEMIKEWLKKYNINNYTIKDDFTIDVVGNVNLNKRNLVRFPEYIQFGVVKGYFDYYNTRLTSLKGAPKEVGDSFYCSNNQLTSLEGVPETVEGFDCSYNELTSLKGAPKEVKWNFDCSHNSTQFTEEDVLAVCKVKGFIITQSS